MVTNRWFAGHLTDELMGQGLNTRTRKFFSNIVVHMNDLSYSGFFKTGRLKSDGEVLWDPINSKAFHSIDVT